MVSLVTLFQADSPTASLLSQIKSGNEMIWAGIILPVAFLCLCAFMKYFIGTEKNDHPIWLSMIAEVSIDLLSIMTSWILTYYVLRKSGSDGVSAIVLVPVVISLLLAAAHSKWRNLLKKDAEGSNPHILLDWLGVIFMVFISACWLIFTVYFYLRWI